MANKRQLHIAIVGAGLGGLAAAISISLSGHRATILEQASEIGEVRTQLPHPFITNSSRLERGSKYHQTLPQFSANLASSPKLRPFPQS
jgi:2-polyprenyl-6-methoxyphenol hydroxylase-like FAD-dependent oxidoreductase